MKEKPDRSEYGRKTKGRISRFLLSYNLAHPPGNPYLPANHREKKGLRVREGGNEAIFAVSADGIGSLEAQIRRQQKSVGLFFFYLRKKNKRKGEEEKLILRDFDDANLG